ncbi:hypothetical protein [Actinomyces sp. ZJ308]|nr:hypothetical protein [Actinomyces sp. ZJ308]
MATTLPAQCPRGRERLARAVRRSMTAIAVRTSLRSPPPSRGRTMDPEG